MHTPNPFISVIIPFYNNEEYAERAIESVLQQTFKDLEIILVDNNSTDGTLAILHNYQKKYPEIFKVLLQPKQGASAARNKGLFEARGEWIQILDSDDEILPEKLANQVALTKENEIDLIVGPRFKHKIINNKLHITAKYPETENIYKALLFFRIGSTNSCLWRKQTVLEVNGWNESWTSANDYEMFYRLIKRGIKIAFSPFNDSIVHMRTNSLSRSSDNQSMINHIENAIRLRLMIKEFLKEKGILNKKLEEEFEIDLYFKLLRWEPKAPLFVKNKLKELKLNIPPGIRLKQNFRSIKSKISKKMKAFLTFDS